MLYHIPSWMAGSFSSTASNDDLVGKKQLGVEVLSKSICLSSWMTLMS